MNNQSLIADYYSQHRSELVQFITVRTADAESAQDMVQDLFLRLLDGSRLITPQTLPCLVYTMARHMVVDYFRHRQVHEHYEHQLRRRTVADDTIETIFSVHHITRQLERSMARLSEDCRKIYRLHIYDGMKVSEIAQELQLPYKQVENRLGQARKEVRRRMCV